MADLIFIPSDNFPESLEFAEKYTRSIYKQTEDSDILERVQKLKKQFPFEDDKYCHILRNSFTAQDYQLTRQETIAFINCMSCDKIRINNSFRYCDKEQCPYYFNFETIMANREPIQY
jgi:hypothetical protein